MRSLKDSHYATGNKELGEEYPFYIRYASTDEHYVMALHEADCPSYGPYTTYGAAQEAVEAFKRGGTRPQPIVTQNLHTVDGGTGLALEPILGQWGN